MNYGYVRVSTQKQKTDRQVIELLESGIDKRKIFVDRQSGKDFNRENYQKLKKKLKKGDCIFIKSIDRLGRNYTEIINEWNEITKIMSCDIVVLDMSLLDTRERKDNLIGKFISDIVLQILSFVAENERVNIKQRQLEGIKIAKEKGVRFGKPPKELPDNFNCLCEQYRTGQLTLSNIMSITQVSRATFYRKYKEIVNL
ncbi:MAG: recombinase family protein [Anaeroplasma bactoclasticum]|nr:recombinase family protein [Anaeroplasma bactoclasticum]